MTWVRAAFGAVVMGLALGSASVVTTALDGAQTWLSRLIPALVCTSIAVLLIRPLRRRSELGLTGGLHPFPLGVLVTGGSATLVFGVATMAGWITWGSFDLPTVLFFLLTNGVIALLLEAFPEELTLRGHTYTALRSTHRGWIAALATTLFLCVPALASVFQAALSWPLGLDAPKPSLAPPGEDPASYLFLLTIFGLTLIAARTATGSLYTSIATHLTFLTVNRLTLYGTDRNPGWSAALVTPDAILLTPAYLLLAATIYRLLGRSLNSAQSRQSEVAQTG